MGHCMRVLIILAVLSLIGCFQRINITEIKQAEKYCSDKMGILGITEYAAGSTVIYCISGDSARASSVSLLEDDSSEVK